MISRQLGRRGRGLVPSVSQKNSVCWPRRSMTLRLKLSTDVSTSTFPGGLWLGHRRQVEAVHLIPASLTHVKITSWAWFSTQSALRLQVTSVSFKMIQSPDAFGTCLKLAISCPDLIYFWQGFRCLPKSPFHTTTFVGISVPIHQMMPPFDLPMSYTLRAPRLNQL